MKRLIFAIILLWPALAAAQAPGANMSAESRGILLQRDFQNLATDLQAVLEAAKASDNVIARQKAQLEWWSKTWPAKRK